MKAKQDVEKTVELVKVQLKKSEQARTHLQDTLNESTSQMLLQKQKSEKLQELVIAENGNWNMMDQEKEMNKGDN